MKDTIKKEQQEFSHYLIEIRRTAKVTAGGKRLRFHAVVVVGDKNGKVGIGIGKAQDVPMAIEKAIRNAKNNLINIPIVNETIPYQVSAKYKAARILLRPGALGKGIIAGGPVKVVCELAGIKNITTKLTSKTKNKKVIIKAVLKALEKLSLRYNLFYKDATSSNTTQS